MYFQYSHSPIQDMKVSYFPEPYRKAKIGSIGRYCVALDISEAAMLDAAKVRVVLSSTWK